MIKRLLFITAITFFYFSSISQQKSIIDKKAFNQIGNKFVLPSPSAIAGNMICYGYKASTTQTLDLTLNVNNADLEYVDSLSITFPAGITPISSPDNTFPTINNNGGYCYYNGVIGQTITWGENNNDLYGGVYGSNLNFRVVANVGALTSAVTASFHLSGDGYFGGGVSADLNGTFQIKPKQAVDYRIIGFSIPYVGCLNTNSEFIAIQLRNDGYNSATGTTTLSYKVNNNALVSETTTLVTLPDDTLTYYFNAFADFSAFTTYTVLGSVANTLDADLSNNTITKYTESFPKNTLPYQTGCEATPALDLLNWYGQDFDSQYSWDTTDITPHSGRLCFRMLETSPTTCEDYLFSPCLDMQAGKTYELSYWTRLTSGYVGSFGAFLLTGQTPDSIQQVLKSANPLVDNSTWKKDSVTFTVANDGVYHIGFLALNYTEEIIAMRLDDILIKDLSAVAVLSTNELDEISIYPNPTKNKLNLYTPNSLLNFELYNSVGQLVLNDKTNQLGLNTIDIDFLPTGVYLIKIHNNRNVAYKKIIKQ